MAPLPNPSALTVGEVVAVSIATVIAFMMCVALTLLTSIRNSLTMRSRILNEYGERYELSHDILRSRFMDEIMINNPVDKNHPHGRSAMDRSMGSGFIQQFAKNLSRRVWYYQCSASDQRNGRVGSRDFFWAKDLTATPAVFAPQGGDLVAMVDVDQYIEMPSMMTEIFRPYLLYTFQPGSVAKSNGEFTYMFNEKHEVVYRVSGGACYTHNVWNYNMDSLKMTKYFFGFPIKVATYLVDKRATDDDHQVILLSPLRRFGFATAWLADNLEAPPLSRLNPVEGEFVRMAKYDKDGVTIHTGKVNRYVAVSTSAETDAVIESLATTSKVGLTLPQVKTNVKTNDQGATILYEYYTTRKGKTDKPATNVLPAGKHVRRYQFDPDQFDPEAKPSMVSYMAPILDGGFAPDITLSNAQRAIKGRLTDARSSVDIKPFHLKVIDEFTDMFLGKRAGTLAPMDPSDVYERQNRPTQRRIIQESEFMEPRRVNNTFMKKEAYGKISDPRIISTINGRDKIDYSQFMYAFGDLLKVQPWYAFSKTPIEISQRVAEICSKASRINSTDFERMDGHIAELYRFLERQLFIRAFKDEYTAQINELLRSQMNLKGFMVLPGGEVETFEQVLARLSGSPETSSFNTIDSAFTAFLAARRTKDPNTGMHYTKQQAWDMLGIYAGDDGLTADIPAKNYVKAARECGQILDIVVTERHFPGLKFLSRVYGPDVFSGCPVNMTDLPRTLSKFHMTTQMPSSVTPTDKLLDKAAAYYLTDKNTPILGPYVTAVLKKAPRGYRHKNICQVWNAQYDASVQYPNEPLEWMKDYAWQQLPSFNFTRFTSWIEECKTLEDLMSPPMCHEPIAPLTKYPAVVDDDIVMPSSPLLSSYNDDEENRASTSASDEKKRKMKKTNRGPPAGKAAGN